MVNRSQRHLVERQGYDSGGISGAPGTILAFTATGGLGRATYNISPGAGCFQVGVYWVPAGETLDKAKHVRHGVPTAPLTPMTFVDGDPGIVNLLANGNFSASAPLPDFTTPPFTIEDFALVKAPAPSYAMSTLDGTSATYALTPYNADWPAYYGVDYSPSLNRLVAINNGSALANQFMTSDDGGITWVARAAAEDSDLNGVAWAASISKFVAVGLSGTNRGQISSDGITWAPITNANFNALGYRDVCWSPELSLFVAVAQTNSTNAIATSPDGVTWTRRASAGQGGWQGVCWAGPPMNLFVAVSSDLTKTFRVATSPDGITWTGRATPFDATWTPRTVAYSPSLNRLVGFGNAGSVQGATSTDGINWTEITGGLTGQPITWTDVAWGNGRFLLANTAPGNAAAALWTSTDGLTWTPQTDIRMQGWRSIVWAQALGKFVAVASGPDAEPALYKDATWPGFTFKLGEVLRFGTKVVSIGPSNSTYRASLAAADPAVKDVLLQGITSVGDWMHRRAVDDNIVLCSEFRISGPSIYSFTVDDVVMFRETGKCAPQGVWDLYPFASTIGGLELDGFTPVLGVKVI